MRKIIRDIAIGVWYDYLMYDEERGSKQWQILQKSQIEQKEYGGLLENSNPH